MNEQAIIDSYNLFVESGYKKSLQEFKQLLASNPEAVNDSYGLFQQNGYKKSIDEYKTLMGIGATVESPMAVAEEPKKKGVMASPFVDGGLEPTKFDPRTGQVVQETPAFAQKQPEVKVPEQKMPARAEFQFQPGKTLPTQKAAPLPKFVEEQLTTVTPALIGKTEESVVPQLKYQYGPLGFKFEETGAGDYMTATSPSGESIEISLDIIDPADREKEANKLNAFLRKGATTVKNISTLQKQYVDANKKITSQKELDDSLASINAEEAKVMARNAEFAKLQTSLESERARLESVPPQQRNNPEYIARVNDFMSRADQFTSEFQTFINDARDLSKRGQQLNKSIGKYTEMKAQQGTWYGAALNAVANKSIYQMAKGFSGLAIDFMAEVISATGLPIMSPEDYEKNFIEQAKKEGVNITEGQDFISVASKLDPETLAKIENRVKDAAKKSVKGEFIGDLDKTSKMAMESSGVSPEYYRSIEETFVGGALLGALTSIPAMAGGPVTRTILMSSQVLAALDDEMANDPAFADISENEKLLVKVPIAVAVAYLENKGLSNLLKQKGFLNGLVLKALGKVGTGASYKTFGEVIKNEIDSAIGRGALTLGAGVLAEVETGALQEVADIGAKEIYNMAKEKEMFDTPDSLVQFVEQVGKAGLQEGIGAGVLAVPGSVSAAYRGKGFLGMDDAQFAMFEKMANDSNIEKGFVARLKSRINSGEITSDEGKEILDNYNNSVSLFNSLPDNLDMQGKKEAMNLLKEKRDLENQIAGKDQALTTPQRNRVTQINEQLTKLSENAIQKQAAGQVPVQPGTGVGQEVAQGEPQAEPQGVTQEGQVQEEVAPTQQPDIEGEVSRLEQLFAEQETAPTQAAGVSISNDTDVEELRNRTQSKSQQATTQEEKNSADTKVKIIDTAKKAIKTLKSVFPDVDIVIHDDEGSYNAAMSELDAASGTRGNFFYETTADGKTTGRIDINLSRANSRTVAHEIGHGILLKTFGENTKLFNDFRTRLSKVLKADVSQALNNFADQYVDPTTGQLLEVGHEEFLVELTGMLEQQQADLSVTTMQKVAALINEFISKITGGKFKPFEDTKNTKDVVDFFNTVSSSIREGSEIQKLNTQEPYSSGVAIPVSNPQEFVGKKFRSQLEIGDYKFPSNIDILRIANLPIKTLTELVRQYEGRVVIITSDATGYGVDRNGDPILGGFGFASNEKNVNDGIGFASVSTGTVKGTYTAAQKAYGTGKTLVLVMIQPPHTTINNSYGAKYIIRGLKEIAVSSKEELRKTKEAIKEFIKGSTSIQKELKKTDANQKRGSEKRLFDFIDSIDENTNLEEAVKEFLNDTTFTIRTVLGQGILFKNKDIRATKSTNYSKIALNNVGYNIYDFLKEYGDNTILTDDLILNNIGGYVVGGFELDVLPKEQREALINDTQNKGIVHPLFNAKLPGTNHFRLDGLYGVQENFSEYAVPDTQISLSNEERDNLVREIYKDDNFYKASAREIPLEERSYTNLTVAAKTEFKNKYLKPQGLLIEAVPNVPTKVAKGEGFIPKEGAAEQIAKGEFVSKAPAPVAEVTPKSKRVSKSQIIGENAELEGVVRHNLGVAKILSREGVSPERVKLFSMGWELGSDGKWRYEIPDGKFKENIDISRPSKLEDIFDAPDLFKAYPEARNIEVEFKLLPGNEFGNFDPSTKSIIINRSIYKNNRDAANLTMLHEIQHWIQVKELFQGGSSSVAAKFKMDKIVDYFEKLVKKRESIYDTARLFYADNQEVVKEAKDLLDFAKGQYDILKELTFEKGTKEEKVKAAEMIKNLSDYAKRGIVSAQNLIDELSKKNPADAFNLYYRVAGEVEARNVEYRNKLTPSQRRNILLSDTENIDREDQIMLDSFGFVFEANEMKDEFRVSRSQLDDQDRINKLINEARAQGFSEEAIILFLQRKGLTDNAIDTAMAKAEPAAKKVEVTEEFAPGYDRVLNNMFGEKGIVTKSRERGRSEEDTLENAINYLGKTRVYINATDVQREAMVRNLRKEFKKREKAAPSAEKVVGKPKKKQVTVDEMAALKDQIKLEARAAREAKGDLNSKRKALAAAINKLAEDGKITAKKAETIAKRALTINLDSEVAVNKFLDYVSKVFADAEYASKLSNGNTIRRKIRKASRNKDKSANLRDLGVKFSEIDPSMVDDIDQYNEIAEKILKSIEGSSLKSGVKFAEIVKIADVSDYINTTIEKQRKEILKGKIDEMSELLGIEITEEEYFKIIESINNNEPLPKKYKDGAIRKAIDRAFNVYSAVIDDIFKTGKDPITGEEVSISDKKKKVVKDFMSMDLNLLSDKEALAAIDSLLNFIQNGSTAKMSAIYNRNLGEQNAVKLDKKGFKSFKLKKYFSPGLAKVLVEQFTQLDLVIERMFKGFNKAGDFMFESGISALKKGKSIAQSLNVKIVDNYFNKFYKSKPNGQAFNTIFNTVERGMTAYMMRTMAGTEAEINAEFKKKKGLIEQSIANLKKGNDKQKELADVYTEVYNKLIEGSENYDDVVKKADPKNVEAVTFWQNEWANKYEDLSDLSESIYNKTLGSDLNYTPVRVSNTGQGPVVDENSDEMNRYAMSFHTNNQTTYQRETGVLMTPTLDDKLSKGAFIDLSFDKNNANSMYDALVDLNTADAVRQVSGFFNSDSFENIIQNSDDAKILKGRVNLFIRNIRNKNPYDNDEFAKAIRGLQNLAALGAGRALAGPTQALKQTIPVIANTITNAGSIDLAAPFNKDKNDFINNSGYAIANRSAASNNQIESVNKLAEKISNSLPSKIINPIADPLLKLNELQLKLFLQKPDAYVARASWITYYEKSLKQQGIDPSTIDYATHQINDKAADYAQRMVDRQQNLSDMDLAGKFVGSKNPIAQFVNKTIMPFSSFRINQSARLGADWATITSKVSTKEDKVVAARSLGGFFVELSTFRAVSATTSVVLASLAALISGRDDDEEDREKLFDTTIKGATTSTILRKEQQT